MQNIKIILEYDGTNYSGWQIQKNTPMTIQQKLEDALEEINKAPVRVVGSGRTDAGVHALAQVANFELNVPVPVEKIPVALNRLLPSDIVCKEAVKVDSSFHSRYDTIGKKYRYRILNRRLPSVFIRNYVYHYIHKLDIESMKEAAGYFKGTHDFSSFQTKGCGANNTVKTIYDFGIIDRFPEIWIEVKGDGFLYNMVRIITGTLIEVATGKKKIDEIENIITAREREQAGFTAPAKGLTLVEVYY